MSVFGKIQEFKPEAERFSTYVDRLKLYFDANEVRDDKKVAVFLTVIGAKNYALLSDFCAPDKPQDSTLEVLVQKLTDHYEPPPIVISERFHFHKRDQRAGESIADFIAELRRLSTKCKFGNYLDEAIRDRFVCGLANEATQQRLLIEKDLTLAKAIEIATSWDSAEKNTQVIKASKPGQGASRDNKVNAVVDTPQDRQPCKHCGKKDHTPNNCKFRTASCYRCGKRGHISSVCRDRKPRERFSSSASVRKTRRTKWLQAETNEEELSDDGVGLFNIGDKATPPIVIKLRLNNQEVSMELDTGAAVSLVSEKTQKELFPDARLRSSSVTLKTYTAQEIAVLGEFDVEVMYHDHSVTLPLVVIQGSGPSLLGRNWLHHIRLDWQSIKQLKMSDELETLLEKYKEVFSSTLGTMNNFTAKLRLKTDAQPKFFRPRPVPFSLKNKIEEELQRLEAAGIISKVSHSQWAAPIVAVPKKDGKLRLCGDYKVTLNPSLQVEQYPLPKPEDLFATLSGGKVFSKIDHSQAYQQMLLDESCKELVTINTHRGLYRYNRLPFGIASAPALFQRAMDTILEGTQGVICYMDDILVTGKDS